MDVSRSQGYIVFGIIFERNGGVVGVPQDTGNRKLKRYVSYAVKGIEDG